MFGWRVAPLCILMALSACASLPLGHRGALSFSNSLRLTMTIRARVQELLARYNKQLFGDERFEYRELTLGTLPTVTVSYQSWLQMQDFERMRMASQNLHVFWTHLDAQRQQLERETSGDRREQRRDKRGKPLPDLCQSFEGLQIDLRDLMNQVSYQLNHLTPGSESTTSPLVHPLVFTSSPSPFPSMQHSTGGSTPLQSVANTNIPAVSTYVTKLTSQTFSFARREPTSSMPVSLSTSHTTSTAIKTSRWVQHLNGHVVLRDLERYLIRLARDYSLLRAKY